MNSYEFFIYEFRCYMNSGVPRFQMLVSSRSLVNLKTFAVAALFEKFS